MPFWVGFSKGHSACTRVVSWLDQELPEKQLLSSLHTYCTHTGMYGISDFLFSSTRYEDPFWHKAQFISWLQHRLLEPERMLYFEGDAAGEKLLLFVLHCKSPSSTQKKGWFNDQRNAFKKHENKAKAFPCCRSAYCRANTMYLTVTVNGLIINIAFLLSSAGSHFWHWLSIAPFGSFSVGRWRRPVSSLEMFV